MFPLAGFYEMSDTMSSAPFHVRDGDIGFYRFVVRMKP